MAIGRRAWDPGERDDPVRFGAGIVEERRSTRGTTVAPGSLACPRCDAPVAPAGRRLTPAAALACPVCAHEAPVRAFLVLGEPTRPARVRVVARMPAAGAADRMG